MLSCSIWFSAPSFWLGGGLESCCVGRVYGADGAVHHTAPSNLFIICNSVNQSGLLQTLPSSSHTDFPLS